MDGLFGTQSDQLGAALAELRAIAATEAFAGSYAVNGVSVDLAAVVDLLESSAGMLALIDRNPATQRAIAAHHKPQIDQTVAEIRSFVASASGAGKAWLEQSMNTLLTQLVNLRRQVGPLVPIDKLIDPIDSTRFIEIQARAQALDSLEAQIYGDRDRVAEHAREAKSKLDNIASSESAFQVSLSKIQVAEQTSSTARAAAEASAASAAEEKKKVDEDVRVLTGARTEKESLFREFEAYREQVEALLEGASKVGLARSFASRKDYLQLAQYGWAGAFALGIVALVVVGFSIFVPVHQLPPLIDSSGKIDLGLAIARILLAGPAIWFTWFAAKQFGHILRLAEDYAFKEAAALAFVGYRNEMAGDAEMVKLLQNSAIHAFGANPARLLGRDAAASPVQEAIQKAMEKGNFEKAIDLLKALIPGKS